MSGMVCDLFKRLKEYPRFVGSGLAGVSTRELGCNNRLSKKSVFCPVARTSTRDAICGTHTVDSALSDSNGRRTVIAW
jgi:hypothetical protein